MNLHVAVIFLLGYAVIITSSKQNPNVLFIAIDDLRPQLGCYEGPDFPAPVSPKMRTPHLDELAKRSLLLLRAYVQQSICAPSRTSLLTGRRPDTTHVYDLRTYWRESGGNFTSLPQYFKENGYRTIGLGKIFHPGTSASGPSGCDEISWTDPCYVAPHKRFYSTKAMSWQAVAKSAYSEMPLPDQSLADKAITMLKEIAPDAKSGKQPFFLAVGFDKPHLPFVFPEEFLDVYENVSLPSNMHAPFKFPPVAWSDSFELWSYHDLKISTDFQGEVNTSFPGLAVEQLRRAYYSSVTYIDSLVGKVLKELKDLGLENDTIVTAWGDHGWHLGENGIWSKGTNFEMANHAPMMVAIPGLTDYGIVSRDLVEFVDLYPTLVEAAGLPEMPLCPENSSDIALCREGQSMLPLIYQNDNSILPPWKRAVFSQYPRDNMQIMGYSIRTDNFRYTEWVKFSSHPYYGPQWDQLEGVELYNHQNDPQENINQADNPEYELLRNYLSEHLHLGWRNA